MGRSFFSGVLLGCVLSAAGVIVLSQVLPHRTVAELPERASDIKPVSGASGTAMPVTGTPEVSPGSEFARGRIDGPARLPGAMAAAPTQRDLVRPEGSGAEGLTLDADVVESALVPATGAAATGLTTEPALQGPRSSGVEIDPLPPAPEGATARAPVADAIPDSTPVVPETTSVMSAAGSGQGTAGFPLTELSGVGDAPRVAPPAPEPMPVMPADPEEMPQLPGQMAPAEKESAAGFQPAIRANAVAFQAEAGRPEMAIVLIDTEGVAPDLERLGAFPYPLSFAVDAGRSDAAARAEAYRAAGFEVLAMVRLPEGADAAQIASAGDAWVGAVPQAVGVLEAEPGALQQGRAVTERLAARLLLDGYGAVFYPDGQDVARKLSARAGVPSDTLFRELDAAGADEASVQRMLEAATERAQSEKQVIVVGHPRPATIQALLTWALGEQAGAVQLVPVSAALRSAVE